MKILTVIGARPQFIKAATVTRVIGQTSGLDEVIVHTGQHFDPDMSDVFFDELGLPQPHYRLGVHGGGHGDMTGRMLGALEEIMQSEQPDWVLVYGDTNSTLAGALAAAKLHVPVAHVEAGLRSYNRRMPEELNRIVVDHVSDLLLCPTSTAMANLRREGLQARARRTGDVMYDAALHAAARTGKQPDVLARMGLEAGAYAVATVHRAENTDSPEHLREILDYLREQAKHRPLVLPLHPRTRQAAARFGLDFTGLKVCPTLGYFDMARMIASAAQVFTDSGGVQKEAYFHRTPCVTLRTETEWPETIEAGWNRLWRGPPYAARRDIDEYGDGRAANQVVAAIMDGEPLGGADG